MRCANCGKIIPKEDINNREGYEGESLYKCYCAECGDDKDACRDCSKVEIEKCFGCRIKEQGAKLDLFCGDFAPQSSVVKCFQANRPTGLKVCESLVADTKLCLKSCLADNLKVLLRHSEPLECLFEEASNEGSAICWLPITTSGTFYETGIIPKMEDCLVLSEYLEAELKIPKGYKAKTMVNFSTQKIEYLSKEEWLLTTFDSEHSKLLESGVAKGLIKGIVSNCKILDYFMRQPEGTIAPGKIPSMLEDIEKLLKKANTPEHQDLVVAARAYVIHLKTIYESRANQSPSAKMSITPMDDFNSSGN